MYADRHDHIEGAALHDPLAVMAVTNPDLFAGADRNVTIETRGEHTSGMTVIDRRGVTEELVANCHVLEQVDDGRAWRLVIDALTTLGAAP
jgi:inosine-uridine nucleoside N-ribohydrolase